MNFQMTGVIPMGQEAELSLISYFGRFEVVDEVENKVRVSENAAAENA